MMGKFKEIKVKKTDEGTVVDFWPGMFVKPSHEKEPTKSNPDVKVDIGMVGRKMSPVKAYYPEDYDFDKILQSTDSIDNTDSLFSKIDHCPICERKRREIIERLRESLKKDGSREDRLKSFLDEGNKIKAELKEEIADIVDEEDQEIPPSPPPPLPSPSPPPSMAAEQEVQETPGVSEFADNVNKAIIGLQQTVIMLLNTPEQIKLPKLDDTKL